MTEFLHKSIDMVKKNPTTFLYILLLDIGFLAVFYLLTIFVKSLVPSGLSGTSSNISMIMIMLALFGLYIVIVVLVYSFFSLIILGRIKSLTKKSKLDISLLKSMFGLNLLLFVMFFLVFVLFNFSWAYLSDKNTWITYIVLIVLTIISMFLYAFYHFSHSILILKHEFMDNLKYSLRHVFSRSYIGIYAFSLAVLLAYAGFFFIFSSVFENYINTHYNTVLNVTSVITILVVYVLFSFNRVYFFFVAENGVGNKKH